MTSPRSENCASNINASFTVDLALSLCDVFKEAVPQHKDFHLANNSSINCVSDFSECSVLKSTPDEALTSTKQCKRESNHQHRPSVMGESFTIKLNDLDRPTAPTRRQRLFAEERKKKAEKHIYSHPAMIAALIESDDDDDE